MNENPKASSSELRNLDPAHLLTSPRLAQWVLGVLVAIALGVLLPLVFQGPGAGEAAHRFVTDSVPLLALYLLLAGSVLACMVRRAKSVVRKLGAQPRPRLKPADVSVIVPVGFEPRQAAAVLRRAGYRHVSTTDRWAWGVKHRWSPLGTLLLHAAVLLGFVGAALAALPGMDRVEHLRVMPGERARVIAGSPHVTLQDLSARPGEGGALAALGAVVTASNGRRVRLRPDMPALIDPTTALVIEDYDLAPTFSVVPTSSLQPAFSKTAPLRLRRDGAVDRMTLSGERLGTYRLTVRLDRGDRERVVVLVERRDKALAGKWRLVHLETVLSRGELVKVGKARLRFDGLQRWAVVRAHRAPSAPVIGLALLVAVVGACLRLLLPRAEATVAIAGEGCAATVSVDAYRGSRSASAALAQRLGDAL